ncbi:hypothetical protein NERG_02135 [Nematocida ausubeli]|uniref:Uncharacterized protein n=1 Tax=Nematocida ausubeli (strain ATCC PRA-371 / ERTm2) TaxID=1913371 RepID=H8ZEW6_NEMA1|nr:hypothetical protein NERG_02135 [Nematocida ausubeli]
MECTEEELYQLVLSLVEDLEDPDIVKYKRKMINLYIKLSVEKIYRKDMSLASLYSIGICIYSFLQQMEENEKIIKSEAKAKIQEEVVEYICKREVLKIRAIILDTFKGTYTEDKNYSVKPEEWAVKIIKELSSFIGEDRQKTKDSLFAGPRRVILEKVEELLAQEIKEAFVSKSKLFGKKGNLLVLNILYIEKYFKRYTKTDFMEQLVQNIHKSFKDPDLIDREISKYVK